MWVSLPPFQQHILRLPLPFSASIRITQLYDRRPDDVTLYEVEGWGVRLCLHMAAKKTHAASFLHDVKAS